MVVSKKIIFYLIPLIVLIIMSLIYWGPEGSYQQLKDVVSGVKEYTPDITVGLDELAAGETTLPSHLLREATALQNTLLAMAKSNKTNCFQSFGGFSQELGEDETTASFLFTYNPAGNSTQVVIHEKKKVIYNKFDVPGMKPCVIAGLGGVAENFFKACIDGPCKNFKTPYYQDVNSITIKYGEKRRNGNIIRVNDQNWPPNAVNDESKNFENDGILFKGPNNQICFFPTNWIRNFDEDGIDNDFIYDSSDEDSLMYKLSTHRLEQCSPTEGYDAIELFADDDATSGEVDCNFREASVSVLTHPIKQKISHLSAFRGEDNDCTNVIKGSVTANYGGYATPDEGCLVLISEDDDGTYNDCGWVAAAPGEILPPKTLPGIKIYSSVAPRYENMDPLCLLNNHFWTNDDSEELLLCAGNKWVGCSSGTEGLNFSFKIGEDKIHYFCEENEDLPIWVPKKQEDQNFTVDEKKQLEDKINLTKKEVEKLNGTNKIAAQKNLSEFEAALKKGTKKVWVNTEQKQPWFKYSGLEHFADDDGNGGCDVDNKKIYFSCDERGTMGTTKPSELKEGFFPCPAEDWDCNTYFEKSHGYDYSGCNLYLSEWDQPDSNDCGWGIIPNQYYIGSNYRELETTEKSAEKEGNESRCLLTDKVAVNPHVGGELLCGKDSRWYLCEARKVGDCFNDTIGAEWCCRDTASGYIFKEQVVS